MKFSLRCLLLAMPLVGATFLGCGGGSSQSDAPPMTETDMNSFSGVAGTPDNPGGAKDSGGGGAAPDAGGSTE